MIAIVSRGCNAAFLGHWYFHLFYYGRVDMQIEVLLTISDAQMILKVCGPLAFYLLSKIVIWMQCNIRYCKNKPSILTCLMQNCNLHVLNIVETAAVAQWVGPFASHSEGCVLKFQLRQTKVAKTGNDSSTAKCLAKGVSVTGPRRLPLQTDVPCHSR